MYEELLRLVEIEGAYDPSDRRRDENIFTSSLQTDSLPSLLQL
jgi:hypothetical protein